MNSVEESLLSWFADGAKPHKCPMDMEQWYNESIRFWLLNEVTCEECLSSIGLSYEWVEDDCPCIVLGPKEAQRRAVQVIHNMEVGDIFF
jgi:hypothetical protein